MKCIWIWPIFAFIFLGVGIIVCYAVAVQFGHVLKPPHWPSVSATGVFTPERGWFTMFLVWGAIMNIITMYFYYKRVQVREAPVATSQTYNNKTKQYNQIALVVGFISSIGMTMVAAFQTGNGHPSTKATHYVGAFIAFTSLLTYAWIVIFVSCRVRTDGDRSWLIARTVTAALGTIAFIIFVVGLGLNQFEDDQKMKQEVFSHLTSIAEWCQIYFAILFLMTLVGDLKKIDNLKVEVNLLPEYRCFNEETASSTAPGRELSTTRE